MFIAYHRRNNLSRKNRYISFYVIKCNEYKYIYRRKHGAAQDRPAIFLHYSSSVSISNFVPSRNRKCRSRRRGLPRSPTIEIICFSPDGTKQLFFGNGKQKRAIEQPFSSRYHFLIFLYTITQNPKLSRKLLTITETPCSFRVCIISPVFQQHFPSN